MVSPVVAFVSLMPQRPGLVKRETNVAHYPICDIFFNLWVALPLHKPDDAMIHGPVHRQNPALLFNAFDDEGLVQQVVVEIVGSVTVVTHLQFLVASGEVGGRLFDD